MNLLFEEDYKILESTGLFYTEDFQNRYFVIKNFPLEEGLYKSNEKLLLEVEVLVIIPSNYNTSGIDMFWTFPNLSRADGVQIPAYGGDPRIYENKIYERWSRHWKSESWEVKVDNIQKILSRIEWALKNPST
jgi:hypothetical protein